MIRPLALGLGLLASPVFAAGGEPVTPTQTSTDCTDAQVYDAETKTCVDTRDSRLDDADRLDAARELARFGRADDALRVLAALDQPATADALTARGYATRRAGDLEGGIALYHQALALEADHWQARSYLGEGLAKSGDVIGAEAQLAAIRASGGRGSWPERALAAVLRGEGSVYDG